MKKLTWLVLLAVVLMPLSGCKRLSIDPQPQPYPLPEWVNGLATAVTASVVEQPPRVHIYYDNTQSMYGFVTAAEDQAEYNLIRYIKSLRDVGRNYGAVSYTLQNTNGLLGWAEYNGLPGAGENSTGVVHDDYDKKEFYTFDIGDFPDGRGPLSSLYLANELDNTAINVVLTDLSEQNVNNNGLATEIRQSFLSQEGYAACLIGMRCYFEGVAHVANPDRISDVLSEQVSDVRNIYLVLTGPDAALGRFVKDLREAFESYSLRENDQYYISYLKPDTQPTAIRADDIFIAPAAEDISEMRQVEDWSAATVNTTLSMDHVEPEELFGGDDYIPINCFRFADEYKTGRRVINYYIPLPPAPPVQGSDGVPDTPMQVEYRIALQSETSDRADLNEIAQRKDKMHYSYLQVEDLESEEDTEPGYQMTWVDLEPRQYAKEIDISYDVVVVPDEIGDAGGEREEEGDGEQEAGEKEDRDSEGEDEKPGESAAGTVPDILFPPGEDQERFEATSFDFSKGVPGEYLHLHIELPGEQFSGEAIAFNIPVYATIVRDQAVPEWVMRFDAGTDNSYFTHTFNLNGFYKILFGLDYSNDPDLYKAQREVKVADILTAVADLPTTNTEKR